MGEDNRKLALGFISMHLSSDKIWEKHLFYSTIKKRDKKMIRLFHSIPLTFSQKLNDQNYKQKYYFLGIPFLSIKRKNYIKRLKIFGIPFSWHLNNEELMDTLKQRINQVQHTTEQQIQDLKTFVSNSGKNVLQQLDTKGKELENKIQNLESSCLSKKEKKLHRKSKK